MDADQIKEIQKTIAISIEKHVNGKIKSLDKKFGEYVNKDEEWKKRAEPVIQMGQNIQGFGRVSLYFLGFISAVGGVILLLVKFFKE